MVYFESIRPEFRNKKMRMALHTTSINKDFISEFVDLFSAQGLQLRKGSASSISQLGEVVMMGVGDHSGLMHAHSGAGGVGAGHVGSAATSGSFFHPPLGECHCEGCPHKEELDRISEFYHVFSL